MVREQPDVPSAIADSRTDWEDIDGNRDAEYTKNQFGEDITNDFRRTGPKPEGVEPTSILPNKDGRSRPAYVSEPAIPQPTAAQAGDEESRFLRYAKNSFGTLGGGAAVGNPNIAGYQHRIRTVDSTLLLPAAELLVAFTPLGVWDGYYGAATGKSLFSLSGEELSDLDRAMGMIPGGKSARAARATGVIDEAGGAAKRASWGLSVSETKAALSSAEEAYKGSTVVGHALSKHTGRNSEVWGAMSGSMKTWNEQGMTHLRDVIRSPGQFTKQTYDDGLTFLEKRLPDGRGVRLNMDGTFKSFLD